MEPTNGKETNVSGGNQPAEPDTLENVLAGASTGKEPAAEPEKGDGAKGGKDDGAQIPAWTSQLPEEIKGDAEKLQKLSKFRKIGDLAASYAELEDKLGRSIVRPGEDATDEEKEAFYRKLGKPENVKDYGLDGDLAVFAQVAFDNNLSQEQAKNVFSKLKEIAAGEMSAIKDRQKALLKSTDEALHKEYGEKYPQKIAMMKRGIETYGGNEVGSLLQQAGILYHPRIVKMFIDLGEQSAESGFPSRSAGGGKDSYVPTSEGGTFNFKDL